MPRKTVTVVVIAGLIIGYLWGSFAIQSAGFAIRLADPSGSGPCREHDFWRCRPSRGTYLDAVNPFHFQLNPFMSMILEGHEGSR